jgi:hypothetical protein
VRGRRLSFGGNTTSNSIALALYAKDIKIISNNL